MQYSKKLLEHFTNPKNQGVIDDFSGAATVGNPVCGDMMKIYIKVAIDNDRGEIIEDIRFETLGCASAIATSSAITSMAKGKTLDEAMKITKQDVADELDGLPPVKMHCSNIAEQALRKAIEDYRKKAIDT